jgi:hypothetical protein
MAIYRIYMRSFAPWREFGTLAAIYLPVRPVGGMNRPPADPALGGPFHGDNRGFSLDTTSPHVTSRINAYLDVDLSTGSKGDHDAWCDESRGPWMGIGPAGASSDTGSVEADFTVSKSGQSVQAIIEYASSNPLVKVVSPDIDAKGEFKLTPGPGNLTIEATITGDQFPACESFIQDPRGNKLFLGGFAPPNKREIMRLFGSMNKPQEVWFESHIVVNVDSTGSFRDLQGGGSGSNSTGPACETLTMSFTNWNARIMGSILMPSDAL